MAPPRSNCEVTSLTSIDKSIQQKWKFSKAIFCLFLFEQATNFRCCSDKIYRGTAEVLSHTYTAKGGSKV